MTQEDKQLLLADLCARLPYNVLVHIYDIDVCDYDNYLCEDYLGKFRNNFIRIKPYLRQMSSMTEEEVIEFNNLPSTKNYQIVDGDLPWDVANYKQIDWLNKKGFDYRGLIKKGLALEAPEGMYGKEEQQ